MVTKCEENQSRTRLSLGLLVLATILVWVVTGCGGKTPTPVAAVQPPEISEPKVGAPTPLKPGEEAGISVEVSKAAGVTLTYTWTADGGEIVRGQESPAITYRAPDEPGTYNVRVVVKWDNQSVEKATSIKVEAGPPTPTCLITEPADGDENLGFENDVKVTCSDVPDSLYIWILVYSFYDSNFYPKPGPIGSGSGDYRGTAFLGIEGTGDGKGIGDQYGIIVALADEVVSWKLRQDALSFSGYALKLPDGVEEKDRITVRRGY